MKKHLLTLSLILFATHVYGQSIADRFYKMKSAAGTAKPTAQQAEAANPFSMDNDALRLELAKIAAQNVTNLRKQITSVPEMNDMQLSESIATLKFLVADEGNIPVARALLVRESVELGSLNAELSDREELGYITQITQNYFFQNGQEQICRFQIIAQSRLMDADGKLIPDAVRVIDVRQASLMAGYVQANTLKNSLSKNRDLLRKANQDLIEMARVDGVPLDPMWPTQEIQMPLNEIDVTDASAPECYDIPATSTP